MKKQEIFSSRIEELYRILTEPEKRELARYLASPYFNRDKNLSTFHEYLVKEQPEKDRYNRQVAWRFMFPKAGFNDKKFRYLVSALIAGVEEFIYTQQVLNTKPNYTQLLNEYYTLREATKNKSALATKIKSGAQGNRQVMAPEHYLEKHFESELLEELHTTSLKTYSRYIAESKKHEPGELDAYYVIEKLRQMCIIANDNNVFGLNTVNFYTAEILKLAEVKKMRQNIFVEAYLCVYTLLTQRQEESYRRLKTLLDKFGYDIEDKNLAELFTYARNFCISRINAGQSSYFEELFELYEQGLAKRALLLNGEINERNYKNIVTTALRTGKYEWTHDFIADYRYKLNKQVRDNAFNYNLANYYFHTKQYARVLDNLQKVQLSDLFYGLDSRSLIIKCYYELDEKEAFMNAYYSFRTFVQRRKNVSEQHRRNYLNFLRIAKKLINLRPGNKKTVETVLAEIKNSKALADKGWLEEKIRVYA